MGWEKLSNSKLLKAAEEAGFEVLLTGDKGPQIPEQPSKV